VSHMLHVMAERLKRRGLIILISDLLDDPDKIISGLRHFRHNRHEVCVFQLLDPQELQLDYDGDVVFEDLETTEKIKTYPSFIRQEYQNEVRKYIEYFRSRCYENRIDYQLIETRLSLDVALMDYLIKRNRLK